MFEARDKDSTLTVCLSAWPSAGNRFGAACLGGNPAWCGCPRQESGFVWRIRSESGLVRRICRESGLVRRVAPHQARFLTRRPSRSENLDGPAGILLSEERNDKKAAPVTPTDAARHFVTGGALWAAPFTTRYSSKPMLPADVQLSFISLTTTSEPLACIT